MKLHIIMHESFEAPGAIQQWAEGKGYNITYTKLYEGDAYPTAYDFDFLVVMGGPQSPATTIEESAHFNAKKEIDFIKGAIEQDKILLGVCLGAQMIGEALGASFEHSPNKEIGVFPITLTAAGKADQLFKSFPEKFMVGHWHGDMPGLTADAAILATSEGCPRQIVRYSPKIYGFQCHFEFNAETIEAMIQNSQFELEQYKGMQYVETAEQLRAHDYSEMNNLLFQFLNQITTQADARG